MFDLVIYIIISNKSRFVNRWGQFNSHLQEVEALFIILIKYFFFYLDITSLIWPCISKKTVMFFSSMSNKCNPLNCSFGETGWSCPWCWSPPTDLYFIFHLILIKWKPCKCHRGYIWTFSCRWNVECSFPAVLNASAKIESKNPLQTRWAASLARLLCGQEPRN